jgi:hypothetical protein
MRPEDAEAHAGRDKWRRSRWASYRPTLATFVVPGSQDGALRCTGVVERFDSLLKDRGRRAYGDKIEALSRLEEEANKKAKQAKPNTKMYSRAWAQFAADSLSQCIGTDDPRLKEK